MKSTIYLDLYTYQKMTGIAVRNASATLSESGMSTEFSDMRNTSHLPDSVTMNSERISRMLGNKNEALYISLWERFKDWCSSKKKPEVLEATKSEVHTYIYNIISRKDRHPDSNASKAERAAINYYNAREHFSQLREIGREEGEFRLTTRETAVHKKDGSIVHKTEFLFDRKKIRSVTYTQKAPAICSMAYSATPRKGDRFGPSGAPFHIKQISN